MARFSKLHSLNKEELRLCIDDYFKLPKRDFEKVWNIHIHTMEKQYGKKNITLRNKVVQKPVVDNFGLVQKKYGINKNITNKLLAKGYTFTEILSAEKIGNIIIIPEHYRL